ncbi:cell division protein FtsL [Candidatus Nitrospira bockiana]
MRVVAALAVLSLLLLYVWERVEIVQLGYRIEQLKVKKSALERERDELRVKLSTLTAPDRIAKAATEKLGMVPPQQGQIRLVRLEPDVPLKGQPPVEIRIAKNDSTRAVR